ATAWTATAATSGYDVVLDGSRATNRAAITWGATRPSGYTIQAQQRSGAWTTVASGAVPATGHLDASWAPVKTRALRFGFTGGVAEIAELTVPDPAAAYVTTTLDAPAIMVPGTASTVTLTAASVGGTAAENLTSTLTVPAGWTVSANPAPATIPPGGKATVNWSVTPPAGTATHAALSATTSWQTDSTSASAETDSITPAPLGSAFEAENSILTGGASTADDHSGYTGTGFVGNLYQGAAVTAAYTVPASGTYVLTLRYANSTGGQSPPYLNVTRTVSVAGKQVSLPVTGSWDSWSTVTVPLDLPAGDDLVRVEVGPADSGSVNLDSVTLGTP
ncbi:MAG TPA: NEW3 domain-containing protein, partial [Amycolatopsis sp.]|nr:NEW3 domain-containing protein [Amycolatopsis sp.]